MGLELKYFVLKPSSSYKNDPYAEASRLAILTYADSIEIVDHEFADELKAWVYREDRKNKEAVRGQ